VGQEQRGGQADGSAAGDQDGDAGLGHGNLKGAQMRSCSSAVLMEQTTEQVASMKAALAILADKVQPGGWDRRLKLERPVRTMGVVMLDVDSEHLLQMPAPDDQQPVRRPCLGVAGHAVS
jgi:hypothetical protein